MFKRFRSSKSYSKDGTDSRASDLPNPHATTSSSAKSAFALSKGRSKEKLGVPVAAGIKSRSLSPLPAHSDSGLGLHVVYQPEFPSVDIIFVHGLGGHSQRTWSKNHDTSLFWPKLWLPLEPDIGTARILTFGYNADWRSSSKGVFNISDFAKELLFDMRFSKDQSGFDLSIGTRPVIFVVHSMGGLVVKKAYMFGLHDENYKNVVQSISAIIFLSTPHRGTDLAVTLNQILSASFKPPKRFISDLNRNSPAIEELNEQFRHLAPRLSIWSFYETLATSMGPIKALLLGKDSAVLGYPAEISRPLHADHHDVCKYSSPTDPNYISVRNAIKSLVTMFREEAAHTEITRASTRINIQNLFRNCITSEDEYIALRKFWLPGTCEWFLQEPQVVSWLEPSSASSILWYSAPPGSGKSVLATYIIDRIRSSYGHCQFFIFKYSDQDTRTVSQSLRALAFQSAKDIPEFRALLEEVSSESLGLDSADPTLIWQNTFEKILFETALTRPVYWVIDGLDECNSPRSFLECLKGLSNSKISVRVIIFSRNTDSISIAFNRLSESVPIERIEKTGQDHNRIDIELLAEQEIRHMRGSQHIKSATLSSIMTRSMGNFLWTRLVLDEIMSCHTEESIQEVLDNVPDDMTQLYQRMERNLLASMRKPNRRLVQALLEWTICSQRPLSLKELSHALQPEFTGILDLERTINDTCGQFIQVSDDGKVAILHHTAREYFTKSSDSSVFVDALKTHVTLFGKSLIVLEESDLRWRLVQSQHALQASEPFIFYAAINWSYHLGHSQSSTSEDLDLLIRFFRSSAVLVWVHALALLRRLDILVGASKVLRTLVGLMRKRSTSQSSMLYRLSDLKLIDDWIIDLVKIVGKFGLNLILKPDAIYDVVPALCPSRSRMHMQFHKLQQGKIKVLGLGDYGWTDHIGRFALPNGSQGWGMSCRAKYIAVLASTNDIHIWDSTNFAGVTVVSHGEPVTAMTLNENGNKLVSYGLKTTKVWSVPSGAPISSIANPPYTKAMTIVFADHDRKLLVGGDDNVIRYVRCDALDDGWKILNQGLLQDTSRINGAVTNSPVCLAFNGDATKVGVSYRGAPLSIWRLSDGRCINKCRRVHRNGQPRPSSNWFAIDRFTWNPITSHVLGIYKDGCIFKWHPITDENCEVQSSADEIAASPDGKLFATSSSNGSVRIWNFAYFTVIYQLSTEDLVTGLSFSADSRRLYDLRGGYVNAWESDSINRFSEGDENKIDTNNEDQTSNSVSQLLGESTSHFEAVTAFALANNGLLYCEGYEDGTVRLFQKGQQEGIELARFNNFLNVTHIRWSKDQDYVAIADLAGDIQLRAIRRNGEHLEFVSMPAPQVQLDHSNIAEIFFSLDSRWIFIATSRKCFVYAVQDCTLQACCDLSDDSSRQWMCHPTVGEAILGYGVNDVESYSWTDLKKLCSCPYSQIKGPPQNENNFDGAIDTKIASLAGLSLIANNGSTAITRATLTQDEKHVLLVRNEGNPITQNSMFLELCLEDGQNRPPLPAVLNRLHIPPQVSAHIDIPLGILVGSRLAFLDKDLWFCTYTVGSEGRGDVNQFLQRHYFIPRDWVGDISLTSCILDASGALFWPRDDRVVCIECNLEGTGISAIY